MRVELIREGRSWRIGSAQDVGWISGSTMSGTTIGSAIPAVFPAYATLVDPQWYDGMPGHQDGPFAAAVLEHLAVRFPALCWLGYLETGADDVVFPEAARVALYADWRYVFVLAGPEQAAS